MLMSLVLLIVFTWITLFVAGICLGRWMRSTPEHSQNMVPVTGDAAYRMG